MVKSDDESLSILIPVYNEQRTLARVIANVLQLPQQLEVIAVDDCSSDATPVILEQLALVYPRLRWTRHEKNLGKTAALRTALALSTGDIVIVQDADLEYDPAEISNLIEPIVRGKADVVFGSRFLVRKAARVHYFYHYLANKLFTFCSNLLTNLNLTDVGTGYKAFRGEILRNMSLRSNGFGFDMEVTAKIAKLHCRIYEVPISYDGRTYEEGKKITAMDGVYALWYIFKYNVFVGLSRSYKAVPQLLSNEEWISRNGHGGAGRRRSPHPVKGMLRGKVSKVGS
jgi:glycosyltransferase involved in cell wall biosynthesis